MHHEPPPHTRVGETFDRLRRDISLVRFDVTERCPIGHTIDLVVPRDERRRVWRTLRRKGWKLAPLLLSRRLQLPIVLTFLTAIVFALLAQWGILLATVTLLILYWTATRPWAVIPRSDHETLELVALNNTKFRLEDYRQGLWTSELVAARVRLILSRSLNVPVQELTPDKRLVDLL
jgi:hypothetical protein